MFFLNLILWITFEIYSCNKSTAELFPRYISCGIEKGIYESNSKMLNHKVLRILQCDEYHKILTLRLGNNTHIKANALFRKKEPHESFVLKSFSFSINEPSVPQNARIKHNFHVLGNTSFIQKLADGTSAIWNYFENQRKVTEINFIGVNAEKPDEVRKFEEEFLNTSFPLHIRDFNTYLWSGVYAQGCPTAVYSDENDSPPSKIVGITMSHFRVWKDFVTRQSSENKGMNNMMIVFENDAVCNILHCGLLSLTLVRYVIR